jgi:hypothetical protein
MQELNKQQVEIEENICRMSDQLWELKIPFTRWVRLFFRGHGYTGSSIVWASPF